MSNPTAPTVSLVLDKERHLLLDLNGMVAYEEETGKSLLHGFNSKTMTAKDIRAMLWACLIHEDESLTIQQVGKMIHMGNMNEINASLLKAWGHSMPEPKKVAGGGSNQDPNPKSR